LGEEYNRSKKIEEYEEACPYCDGKGYIPKGEDDITSCYQCRGSGKLDWLERLFGKQSNSYTFWITIKPTTPVERIQFVIELKEKYRKWNSKKVN
jgi:hypothetical protein